MPRTTLKDSSSFLHVIHFHIFMINYITIQFLFFSLEYMVSTVSKTLTSLYNILSGKTDNEIEKKALDILVSPILMFIMNELAKQQKKNETSDGISIYEMKEKTDPIRLGLSNEYNLEELFQIYFDELTKKNIIAAEKYDKKYVLTDEGKKVFKKMQDIVRQSDKEETPI
jgi:hypothetical protein